MGFKFIDSSLEYYALVDSMVNNTDISMECIREYLFLTRATSAENPKLYEVGYFLDADKISDLNLHKIVLCKTALHNSADVYNELKDRFLKDVEFDFSHDIHSYTSFISLCRTVGLGVDFFTSLAVQSGLNEVLTFELMELSEVVVKLSTNRKSIVLKLLRDANFCSLLFYACLKSFDKHNTRVDSVITFGTVTKTISEIICNVATMYSENFTYGDIDLGDLYLRRIMYLEMRRDKLRSMLPTVKYVPKSVPVTVDKPVVDSKVVIPKISTVVSGISNSEKIDYVLGKRILLLKSASIKLPSFSSTIRVYDIESVSKEVLKGDFDCVAVIIKKIGHKRMFRVESLCRSQVITINSTNKEKLLLEIFDKFAGGGAIE